MKEGDEKLVISLHLESITPAILKGGRQFPLCFTRSTPLLALPWTWPFSKGTHSWISDVHKTGSKPKTTTYGHRIWYTFLATHCFRTHFSGPNPTEYDRQEPFGWVTINYLFLVLVSLKFSNTNNSYIQLALLKPNPITPLIFLICSGMWYVVTVPPAHFVIVGSYYILLYYILVLYTTFWDLMLFSRHCGTEMRGRVLSQHLWV